jgi:hypothetical protein
LAAIGRSPIFIPSAFHFYYNFFCCRRSLFSAPKVTAVFTHFLALSGNISSPNAQDRKIKFKDFLKKFHQLEIE